MYLIYTRRSVEASENTVSLAVQYHACLEYARRSGMSVDTDHQHLEHNGVSGADPRRWRELEQKIITAPFKAIIVYTMDRLGRDAAGTMAFLAFCARHHVDLHSVDQGRVESDTSVGFLLAGIQSVVAEHTRRQIGEKVKAALDLRKRQGKRISRHAPFGYRFTKNNNILEDEYEQQAIAQAKEISDAAPGKGYHVIARELFKLGYKSRTGSRIGYRILKRVIHSEPADGAGMEGR